MVLLKYSHIYEKQREFSRNYIVQPSDEFNVLLSQQKNILFYLIGTPFDPTLDVNYTNVPSTLKVPSKQKKIMTTKCGESNEADFVTQVNSFFVYLLVKHGIIESKQSGETLFNLSEKNYSKEGNPFSTLNIDYAEFLKSLKTKFRMVSSKSPKAKSRLLSNYNSVYRESLHAFFLSKNNINIDFKWKLDYSQYVSKNDASKLKKIQVLEFDQHDYFIYNALQSSIQSFSGPLHHQINVVLTSVLIGVKVTSKITLNINLIWQLSYDYNMPEFFIKFYLHAKNLFTTERFPFLHLETLASVSKSLDEDEQFKDISIRFKLNMIVGNLSTLMSKELHPMFLSLKLKELVQESNLPSVAEIVYFINGHIEQMKDQTKSTRVIDKLNTLTLLDNLGVTSLSQAMSEIIAINTSFHEVNDDINILQDSYSKQDKHKTQLDIIDRQATKLALNALDNLEALNALKIKQSALKRSNTNLTLTLEEKAIKSIEALSQEIIKFNQLIPDTKDAHIQSIEFELNRLKAENREQKENLHQLKSQLVSAPSQNHSIAKVPMKEIAASLKSPSVSGVLDIINATYNTIELSCKAKDEITNLNEFLRFDMLFNKLSILASPEFIELYESKGSQACFGLLTRKELAFQESKSTKNKKIREFAFDDGQTRDCKAHLRICSGFQEQNVMRVYFSIEKGKLYIGMIAKHLEVAST